MQRFGTHRSWRNLAAALLMMLLLAACSATQAAPMPAVTPSAGMPAETEGHHDEAGPHDEATDGADDAMPHDDEAMPHEDEAMHGEGMAAMHEAMHGEGSVMPHDDEAMPHDEDMAAMHGIPAEAAAVENPVPADEASIARGAELFQTTCAACHGPEGKGDGPAGVALNPKPANLTEDHVQGNTDGALFYTISNGVPGTAMVAWNVVYSEEDRWNLVNFIRTLDEE